MNITVSVPDDLWADATEPGESPSAVVQDSLRLRKARKAAQRQPFEGDSEILDRAMEGDFSGKLGDLVAQADKMQSGGYTVGVDAALSLSWEDLDRAADPAELRDEMVAWFAGDDDVEVLPHEFYETVHQLIRDYNLAGLTEHGSGLRLNTVLLNALVRGVTDTRLAVVILQANKDMADPTRRYETIDEEG